MHFNGHWCAVGDCADGVRELELRIGQYHSFKLAESVCLSHHHITVLLDSIPVHHARFTLSFVAEHNQQSHHPQPCRLHYGYATKDSIWNEPQDAYFDSPSSNCFVSSFEIFHPCVIGISFVIQLQDGSWLKDCDASDFYIGKTHRRSPACIEVPLPTPWNCNEVHHSRLTSLYKQSPFWMAPEMRKQFSNSVKRSPFDLLNDVMHETVFAVIEQTQLSNHQTAKHVYTVLVFVSDAQRALRTTLFSTGAYPAIRIESGKRRPLSIANVSNTWTCFTLSGPDVYATIAQLIEHVSHRLDHFSSRRQKIRSAAWQQIVSKPKPLLNSLGFCTWDAFGNNVTQSNVVHSLESFRTMGIRFGYVILDDGWQAGGEKGPNFEHSQSENKSTNRPCLQSYGPNDKFHNSLETLQNRISVPVMAWTAAIGYWGGVDGKACEVDTRIVKGAVSRGLLKNNIGNLQHWEKLYEVPTVSERNLDRFFQSYFVNSLAATHKLGGLKIDAQSILEVLHDVDDGEGSEGTDSRTKSLTALYRNAITEAVIDGFPDSVIMNSMACGQEAIFASGSTLSPANICWRTSDDHAFPGTEEDENMVAWHILRNAMNTLLLGEIFPVPDWDMFTAHHKLAKVHAIARVLSGGPMCISGAPSTLRAEGKVLLSSLLTSDGNILRCEEPGRPVVDSIFEDPRTGPAKLFKVFNRSSVNGVIGVFNLHESTEDGNVRGCFAPCDIYAFSKMPGDTSYLSMIPGTSMRLFYHKNQFEPCLVQVPRLDALIVHVSPVMNISGEIQFSAIGNPRLLNAGAVITSIAIKRMCWETYKKGKYEELSLSKSTVYVSVNVSLRDSGDTAFWLNEIAVRRLLCLRHNGSILKQFRYSTICGFNILSVTVPPHAPYEVEFEFEDC